MKFFKKMNEKESFNCKKGITFGFCAYMLISAMNYFYYILTESTLISPPVIFWSGLLAFFAYECILNLQDQFTKNK